MVKTVNLIGPIEPSGLSWLINCLIELNIKCSIDRETWNEFDGRFQLRSGKEQLRRWLPALSDPERHFNFRSEIEVNWSHNWINGENIANKTIFFTREPKSALFSGYKRLGSTRLSFYDYLNEIDPQWLLNRMQLWNLFHGLWSLHPDIKVFLFEDYKTNAIETLKTVIEFLQISGIKQEELERAVEASSFEIAKRSEEKYLKEQDVKVAPMIRQGSLNIEDELTERKAYDLIDLECSSLFDEIRIGKSVEDHLKNGNLNPHVFAYLERNYSLSQYFPTFSSADERLSAYRHISIESINISKKSSNNYHLVSAIQRNIINNTIRDLKLLIAYKSGQYPASNSSLTIELLRILYQVARSVAMRGLSIFKIQ